MINRRWPRTMRGGAALAMAVVTAMAVAPTANADSAGGGHGDRGTVEIPGDPDSPGSKFEGIGLDERRGTFYVSETTGGEISRGNIHRDKAKPWLDGDGTDGRYTARGITVDRDGRVYIAGGPNGSDPAHPGGPDLWVYSPGGKLLAKLDTGVDNAFLNDVAIGPDGAAYFTNSNAPQVFRVAKSRSGWQVSTFVDATGTIATQAGFNLGGIVATGDGRALIVAQGNVGALWRIDLRTKAVTAIAHPNADLVNADGLVLKGKKLLVIRNFSHSISTLKLSDRWTKAALIDETATAGDRVFTTGKLAGNRLYLVDSKFDEQPSSTPPYEVVVLKVRF